MGWSGEGGEGLGGDGGLGTDCTGVPRWPGARSGVGAGDVCVGGTRGAVDGPSPTFETIASVSRTPCKN